METFVPVFILNQISDLIVLSQTLSKHRGNNMIPFLPWIYRLSFVNIASDIVSICFHHLYNIIRCYAHCNVTFWCFVGLVIPLLWFLQCDVTCLKLSIHDIGYRDPLSVYSHFSDLCRIMHSYPQYLMLIFSLKLHFFRLFCIHQFRQYRELF